MWTPPLERCAYPIIGELPVGGISTDLVPRILVQPIGREKDAPRFWEGRDSELGPRPHRNRAGRGGMKLRDGENPARWRGLLVRTVEPFRPRA